MARPRASLGEADVEVVLVEDDAPAPAPGRGGTAPATRRARGRRVLRAAVVTALVLGGAGAAQAWQDRVAAAALAGVPGVVPRMGVAPEVAWSRAGALLRESSGATLIVQGVDDGAVDVVDARTGEVLWSPPGPGAGAGGDCRFVRQETSRSFADLDAGPADAVLCTATTARSGAVASTVLRVHDALTGGLRAERSVDGEVAFVETIGGDVVHAGRDAAGRVEVVRWDPEADADRWRYRSERSSGPPSRGLVGGLAGEVVVLQRGDDIRLLAVTDGSVVPEAEGEPFAVTVADLADGATVDLLFPLTGRGATTVVDRDGTTRVEVPAWFAGPRVLDPRTPALLVLDADGALVAHDVRDGTVLWRRTAEDGGPGLWSPEAGVPLVQIEHRLVLGLDGRLEAVDARDGTGLWAAEGLEVNAAGAVSDGRSVIVPARLDGGEGPAVDVLAALDLRDGGEVWRVPLPWPGDGVQRAGEALVVQGGRGLVGLRPRGLSG